MTKLPPLILGIESSCDDTSMALARGNQILDLVVCNQEIHSKYGGVVPELASRDHEKNMIPTLNLLLQRNNLTLEQMDAIACTIGPGLLGSLIVGTSFAKGLALATNKPLIRVNHMQGHIYAHLIQNPEGNPSFPFLSLTASGGHTQLVVCHNTNTFELIGQSLDDAAGEAFDKSAKMLGLSYPGGPEIDKMAKNGNPNAFTFSKTQSLGFNYSFSGLKTSILYFIQKHSQNNPHFIEENLADLCASIQKAIVINLLEPLEKAAHQTKIKNIAINGGVAANSCFREEIKQLAKKNNWNLFIPKMAYCTDNAAMIAVGGYYRFISGAKDELDFVPLPRLKVDEAFH